MNKLNINNIRIIGDPNLRITRAAFLAGAPGSRPQMEALNSDDVDVLIGGEVPEWETYLNAKDAVALGMKKGVIFLGHTKSEEDGMAYCAEWLKSFTGGVPVVFIKNQPNFRVKKINKF